MSNCLKQLRISAKNLGHLALPNHCPRCSWLQIKSEFKLPFQIFPGIFSSIDSCSKRVTNVHFDKHGKIPKWFSDFGELGSPIKVPHHSTFQMVDAETDILLTGVPDEMFRRKDGSVFIGDYKCARFTKNADALMPIYVVQVNTYALIAEHLKMGTVTGLGLVYYEPQTDVDTCNIDERTIEDGFLMPFHAKLLRVELLPDIIPPLLRKARELADMTKAPEGRSGCKDCKLVDGLVRLLETA